MFNVSTRTQYGLRALIRLCNCDGEGMSVSEIAESEGISPKYLEGIVAQLKSSGILTSQRGKNGGYKLERAPGTITMREVIGALEGDITPVLCAQDDSRCGRSASCPSKRFWDGLKEVIDGYFDGTTLGFLAAGGGARRRK